MPHPLRGRARPEMVQTKAVLRQANKAGFPAIPVIPVIPAIPATVRRKQDLERTQARWELLRWSR